MKSSSPSRSKRIRNSGASPQRRRSPLRAQRSGDRARRVDAGGRRATKHFIQAFRGGREPFTAGAAALLALGFAAAAAAAQLVFDHEHLIGVAGELTLRDVTRPVALKVERLECGKEPDSGRDGCGAGVATSIRRSDFGMNYALTLVGDEIDLSFEVTAFRVRSQGE